MGSRVISVDAMSRAEFDGLSYFGFPFPPPSARPFLSCGDKQDYLSSINFFFGYCFVACCCASYPIDAADIKFRAHVMGVAVPLDVIMLGSERLPFQTCEVVQLSDCLISDQFPDSA